ncbi:MAG: SIS domain-containing protein [Bacteroidota bacterium]
MDNRKFIAESLTESSEVKLAILSECSDDILEAATMVSSSIGQGNKILLCGNGGSAADCQHIAAEFMIRLSHKLQRPAIPAIALTTDTSNLTAGGNDIGFENVFSRLVEGLGREGDILLAISTSGNSPNIIRAAETARTRNMRVIAFLGGNGGKLKDISDLPLVIPSNNTQRIQEGHITVAHIICEIVEEELYGK